MAAPSSRTTSGVLTSSPQREQRGVTSLPLASFGGVGTSTTRALGNSCAMRPPFSSALVISEPERDFFVNEAVARIYGRAFPNDFNSKCKALEEVSKDGLKLGRVPTEYRGDPQIVKAAINQNPCAAKFVPDTYPWDEDLILKVASSLTGWEVLGETAKRRFRDNEKVMWALKVSQCPQKIREIQDFNLRLSLLYGMIPDNACFVIQFCYDNLNLMPFSRSSFWSLVAEAVNQDFRVVESLPVKYRHDALQKWFDKYPEKMRTLPEEFRKNPLFIRAAALQSSKDALPMLLDLAAKDPLSVIKMYYDEYCLFKLFDEDSSCLLLSEAINRDFGVIESIPVEQQPQAVEFLLEKYPEKLEALPDKFRKDPVFLRVVVEKNSRLLQPGVLSEGYRMEVAKTVLLTFRDLRCIRIDIPRDLRENPFISAIIALEDRTKRTPDFENLLRAYKEDARILQFLDLEMKNDFFKQMVLKERSFEKVPSEQLTEAIVCSAVEADILLARHVPLSFWNLRLLRALFQTHGSKILQFSPEIFAKAFCLQEINTRGGMFLNKIAKECQTREVVLAAVRENPCALTAAADQFQSDSEILGAVLKKTGTVLTKIPRELVQIDPFVMAVVSQDGLALQFVGEKHKENPKILMAAVSQNGLALQFVSKEHQRNHEILMAAVSQNGLALQFVDKEHKGNPKILMAAVTQNGLALQFVDKEHKGNPKILMAAVSQNGLALQFVDNEHKGNSNILIAAVTQNFMAAKFLPDSLPSTKEEAEKIVKVLASSPGAWENLKKELKDKIFKDYEKCMSPVVNRSPDLLFLIKDSLVFKTFLYDLFKEGSHRVKSIFEKIDNPNVTMHWKVAFQEVVIRLIDENPQFIQAISEDRRGRVLGAYFRERPSKLKEFPRDDVKNSPSITINALLKDGLLLSCCGSQVKNDKGCVLTAVKQNGNALQYASERLKDDFEVVQAAVRQDPTALQYASSRVATNVRTSEARKTQKKKDEEVKDPRMVVSASDAQSA